MFQIFGYSYFYSAVRYQTFYHLPEKFKEIFKRFLTDANYSFVSKSMMFIIWVEKKDVQININSTFTLYKNQSNTIFSRSIGSWLGSLFWIETLQFIFMLLLMSCWRWTGCHVVREKHWSVIGMFCKQTFTWCSTVKKVTVVLSLQNKNRNIHSKAFSKYSY